MFPPIAVLSYLQRSAVSMSLSNYLAYSFFPALTHKSPDLLGHARAASSTLISDRVAMILVGCLMNNMGEGIEASV
jgi:hypothetical protein